MKDHSNIQKFKMESQGELKTRFYVTLLILDGWTDLRWLIILAVVEIVEMVELVEIVEMVETGF